MVAVMPDAGYDIRKIYPPGVASAPTSGFVPAVICNDFIFVAGQMAHNPGQGLDPRAHVPEHSAWAGTEIRKQTEFLILEKLKPAVAISSSPASASTVTESFTDRREISNSPGWSFRAFIAVPLSRSGAASIPCDDLSDKTNATNIARHS